MREQQGITTNTFIRRASLPPEERTASYHRVGTRAGMHPEDSPYSTVPRNYHVPSAHTYVEVDEEGKEVSVRSPGRSSIRRYDLTPYAGRGEGRTETLPRSGKHPLLYIGTSMLIMLVFLTGYVILPPILQKWSDDRTYGYPRIFQTDANVGHGGTEHFMALNNHGTIEVLEIPSDPSPTNQPHLYIVVRLSSVGADLVPATLSFPDVNGDGKPDLQVTINDGTNSTLWVLFNNGTTFVPKSVSELSC